jgi:hypothetical protein
MFVVGIHSELTGMELPGDTPANGTGFDIGRISRDLLNRFPDALLLPVERDLSRPGQSAIVVHRGRNDRRLANFQF